MSKGYIETSFPFDITSSKPNVARDQFQDLLEMVAYGDCIDDGHRSWVVSEQKVYVYGKDNASLPGIGKWRVFVPDWARQPNRPTYTPADVGAIPASQKGVAGGVAELDSGGKVPSSMLPSYVDDVLEYSSVSDFPVTGESGKIYVDTSTNRSYRWGGSSYVVIASDLALGETSQTAYRGDRGAEAYTKANQAMAKIADLEEETYPLAVTATGGGLYEVGTSVTPSVTLSIRRRGSSVASEANVTVSGNVSNVVVAEGHGSWAADAVTPSGETTVTATTSVTHEGKAAEPVTTTWQWTYYRYHGVVNQVPSNYAVAIKALTNKELSTDRTLPATTLEAGKYYLFAAIGNNIPFTVHHAQTGGIVTGCITGTVTIEQENQEGSNTYSYVLIPASTMDWRFSIGLLGDDRCQQAYNIAGDAYDLASQSLGISSQQGTRMTEIESLLADLEDATFPLTVSATGGGTYEVGTSVTPSVTLSITRKGQSVADSATVSVSGVTDPSIASGNTRWTAEAVTPSSATTLAATTTVTQGGKTADPKTNTWTWTYYRYCGAINSVPSDYAAAIKALTTKELSTTTTLGDTELAANKYYLFAVKGNNVTFVVRDAGTKGIITGCPTGTVTIEQENEQGSNTYSYVLVPAAPSTWSFTIKNT